MQRPNLALPTFVSGPLDSLKTVDPYEIVNGLPESEITSVLDRLDTSFLDKIKPQLNQQSMNAALRMGTDLLGNASKSALNINTILQNGQQLAPELTGALSSIQAATRNSILETVKQFEISPAVTKSLTNVFGNASAERLMGVNGVQNFVSSFTRTFIGGRTPDLSNTRFVSLLLGGVIHQGSKLGLDGFVGDLFNVIDHPQTINLITGLVVKTVGSNGSLADYRSLAMKSTPGYIQSIRPNSINEFIRSYRGPRTNGVRDLPTEFTQVQETFTTIDANWLYRLTTPEDEVINLHQAIGGSQDFNELMQYAAFAYPDVNDWRSHLAHLKNFQSYQVKQEIRQEFPFVVFKTN